MSLLLLLQTTIQRQQQQESSIMSKRPRASMEKGSVGKKPKLPPEVCPICLEEFDIPAKNDQLRILPCTDCICYECLVQLMDTKDNLSTVTCPKCQQPQPLFSDPYGRTTPAVLAELFPTRTKYTQALKRNESLIEKENTTPASNRCCSCNEPATDNCLTCGLQCTRHSESAHAKWPNHLHQSIQAANERKQQEEREEADKILSRCPALIHELNEIRVKWTLTSPICVKRKKKFNDCLEDIAAEIATLTKLRIRVSEWVDQLKSRKKLLTLWKVESDKQRQRMLKSQQSKMDEIEHLKQLPPARIVGMMDELDELFNIDQVRESVKKLEEDWVNYQPTDIIPHPAVDFTQSLRFPVILSEVEPEALTQLNEFLQSTSKTISTRSEMVYKASWHGWTQDAFTRSCVGKGSLIILVKVNDYVFGVYIHPVVPEPDDPDDKFTGVVSDPSKNSFLFSLANDYDHPIRLSLTNPNSAIDFTTAGVGLGYDAGVETMECPNIVLFHRGRPGNDPRSIVINSMDGDATFAYQLEEESKKTAPEEFEFSSELFGGGYRYVGADEIEVYQL